MLCKMQCCTLKSMPCTNHEFPIIYATRNVQTYPKSTVPFCVSQEYVYIHVWGMCPFHCQGDAHAIHPLIVLMALGQLSDPRSVKTQCSETVLSFYRPWERRGEERGGSVGLLIWIINDRGDFSVPFPCVSPRLELY